MRVSLRILGFQGSGLRALGLGFKTHSTLYLVMSIKGLLSVLTVFWLRFTTSQGRAWKLGVHGPKGS